MPLQTNSNTLDANLAFTQCAQVSTFALDAQTAAAGLEPVIFVAPNTGDSYVTITSVTLTFSAAITATPTNFQTFTVNRYNSLGASVTVGVGGSSYATTVAAVAFRPISLLPGGTVTAALPLVLKPGDVLTLKDTASGTGLITPLAAVSVHYVITPILN